MTHALALCFLVGCIPLAPAGTQAGPTSGQEVAASSSGATCGEVIQCFAECSQSAECLQGCMDSGAPEARDAVNALLACNDAGGTCEAELEACSASGGTDAVAQAPAEETAVDEVMLPGQPHTTANILPWLTGYWQGNNYHYNFYEDGRVKRASGVARYSTKDGRYACSTIMNEEGTVRQEGDLLIMEFTAAEENHCGNQTDAAGQTVRLRVEWYQYNGPVSLRLVDIDCTRGEMYCSDPITRR